jgi:hypothetical protein
LFRGVIFRFKQFDVLFRLIPIALALFLSPEFPIQIEPPLSIIIRMLSLIFAVLFHPPCHRLRLSFRCLDFL